MEHERWNIAGKLNGAETDVVTSGKAISKYMRRRAAGERVREREKHVIHFMMLPSLPLNKQKHNALQLFRFATRKQPKKKNKIHPQKRTISNGRRFDYSQRKEKRHSYFVRNTYLERMDGFILHTMLENGNICLGQ